MVNECSEPALAALAALDRALAGRPAKDQRDFNDAARSLAQLRNALLRSPRGLAPASSRSGILAQVNASLSLALAGQFPLGEIPWDAIEQSRQSLAKIVSDWPSPVT